MGKSIQRSTPQLQSEESDRRLMCHNPPSGRQKCFRPDGGLKIGRHEILARGRRPFSALGIQSRKTSVNALQCHVD